MPRTTSKKNSSTDAKDENYESLKRDVFEKELLLSLNKDIAAVTNKNDILKIIRPKLVELFGTEDIFICRFDPQNAVIAPFLRSVGEVKSGNEEFRNMLTSNFPVADRFVSEILNAKRPILMDMEKVFTWPASGQYMKILEASGVRQSISAGLWNGEELLGVLTLWSNKKNWFSLRHKQLIEVIAPQISMMVTNIVYHEDVDRKKRLNDVLLSVSHAIATIRNKSDLIHAIQKTLKTTLRFSDIAITRFDLEKGTFRVFLEYCERSNQHKDFEAIAYNEYPIADGIHNVIMNSAQTVVLKIDTLLNQGMRHIQFLADAGIRELAGIRLQHNEKVIGTLVLLSAEHNAFSSDDREIIQAASQHFATALVNIIYNEEILQRSKEKEILLSTSSSLAAVRNRTDLLPLLREKLKSIPFYNDISIARVDDGAQTFSSFLVDSSSPRREQAESPAMEKARHRFPDGIFERVLESKTPVFFDVASIARQNQAPSYIKFISEAGVVDMVGVSLHDRNMAIGVLFLFSSEKKFFSDSQLSLVQAIGDQLGTTVANLLANEKIELQLQQISHYREQLEEEKQYLQEEVRSAYSFEEMVGSSTAMQEIFRQLSRVAIANTTVLILGETGTGKELIARAIHNLSSRKNNLMVKINCAALPPNLIESELFGHERGSFTGATDKRIGKFELANNGTLFLDEIGELPAELQVKLLRAIQEKEIERIGGKNTIKVNVRIIAATNRDLEKEIEEGRFRQDLYYRLNVFPITLPPLRSRKEDIPDLVLHFIRKYAKSSGKNVKSISSRTMKSLVDYQWPGNVRELEHLIERSVLLSNNPIIKEIHLPPQKKTAGKSVVDEEVLKTHKENERNHIIRVLNKCKGKIYGPGGAAAILNLRVSTLNSKIKKLGIRKSKSYN